MSRSKLLSAVLGLLALTAPARLDARDFLGKSAAKWAGELSSEKASVRRDAASALGDIGLPTASRAWRPLLDLVRSEAAKPEPDDVLLRTALSKVTLLVDNQNKQIIEAVTPLLNGANTKQVRDLLEPA